MYHIHACSIRNFKRIKDIELDLAGDERAWVLIAGDNAQGKSSILDAIEAAIEGKDAIPADPVRHGAKRAEIKLVVVGDTKLEIRRVIKPDRDTELVVTSDGTPVRSPQAVLNAIAGRFLDPMGFLEMKDADQRAELLKLIDTDGAIAKADARHAELYAQRTAVNRGLKLAKAELANTEDVEVIELVSVAAESERMRALQERMADARKLQSTLEDASRRYKAEQETIKRLEGEIAAARARQETAAIEGKAARQQLTALGDNPIHACQAAIDELTAKIRGAEEHNARAAAAAGAIARRAQAEDNVRKAESEVEAIETEMEQIQADKAAALEAAKMPVEGLGFDEHGITLHGVPLKQASSAERLKFALGFAITAGAKLGDVMIRDGSLLDDASLALVQGMAAAAKVRVWIERVGTRDPGAVVIHDGGVR